MKKKTAVLTAHDSMFDRTRSAAASAAGGREWGRKAILAGWVITMVGVVCYSFAMMRAPQDAGLLEALFSQGFLGWIAAVLIAGGVGTWLAGNFAYMQEVVEMPGDEEENEML